MLASECIMSPINEHIPHILGHPNVAYVGDMMHLSKITVENFRCFGEGDSRLEMGLRRGLTALVGENEAGKTALIDAMRLALGTTDQEWFRLEDTDFRRGVNTTEVKEIKIVCKFEGLSAKDKMAFVEYLTYDETSGEPVLFVNCTAKDTGEAPKGRPYRRVDVSSGKNGDGPILDPKARELLRATYLRPLRDAEQALSSGRGSRLAQVLRHTNGIKTGGVPYEPTCTAEPEKLNVLGIGDFANALLEKQSGIVAARGSIDGHLDRLSLKGNAIKSTIKVSGATASDEVRLRQLLEKLDLTIQGEGRIGLGSDNLLFMACELLLLAQEDEGNKLLLIEEPEAHLHPQRQLRVMTFLQKEAEEKNIQIIVTTHSPNLASAIELDNLVMIRKNRAFSMADGKTKLDTSDYRFLRRFLDVTKANLFFANGVMIVEGDAESILMPTLAKIIGRDFTERGVSIVNVGGVGLRRYANIFQRKDVNTRSLLDIPVACLTDMDVMPNCAPAIIGKVKDDADWNSTRRRWKAKKDFADKAALFEHRSEKDRKATGQHVKTFVSDEWTLEYDLALGPKDEQDRFPGGLASEVYLAARLAEDDDSINARKTKMVDVENSAMNEFSAMEKASQAKDGCAAQEVLASTIYAKFAKDEVSKPVAAQYLAERLSTKYQSGELTAVELRAKLPRYLVAAIDYVTGGTGNSGNPSGETSTGE